MAANFISSALDALTSKKGAAIAGVSMLGLAMLVNIARTENAPGAVGTATPAVASAPAAATATQSAPTAAAKLAAKDIFSDQQVAAINGVVRDYLLKNPEIMVSMSQELEKRERDRLDVAQAKLLRDNKAKIFASKYDFVFGNPNGDVSVVEFFDYNCGWCKRALNDVTRLSQVDPKVRVVMKEFPIFGEDSTIAAKAAMASRNQDKYWQFHLAMMREKQVTKANVFTIAKAVGLDVDRLKKDMGDPGIEQALRETQQIAQGLKIEGTPAFIVDGKVNVGYLPTDALKAQIDAVRKDGCKMC